MGLKKYTTFLASKTLHTKIVNDFGRDFLALILQVNRHLVCLIDVQ